MTRAKLERQALNLMRTAMAQGWNTDSLMVDFAVQAMGEECRALIERVHAREIKITTPN